MIPVTVIETTNIINGAIVPELPIEEISQRVAAGEVFVCKQAFDEEKLRAMTRRVFDRYATEEPQLLPYSWGQKNHWRLDDNPPRSSIKKSLALYFSFMWNDEFPEITKMARMLGQLRNRIAGLPAEFGFHEEDSHWVIPTIQHQPKGGGFLDFHSDPLVPDNCVVSLFLTTRGQDYKEGGLVVKDGDKEIDLDGYLAAGDLFIFRPDIPHSVAPVDPTANLRFDSTEGRWRMAAVLNPAVR